MANVVLAFSFKISAKETLLDSKLAIMSIVSESDFYRYWCETGVRTKLGTFRPMQKQFITSSSKLESINEITNTFPFSLVCD